MSDIDAQRAARRAAMPTVSAWLEEYAEFGAKVIYAVENGITAGRKPKDAEVFQIPAGYSPMRAVETKGKK